jgi:cytosine/adenosine deaminase-related metal-dependent hydrolase
VEKEAYRPLDFSDVLYLATRGGAALLNMEDSLGSLDTGKLADILLVDMTGPESDSVIRWTGPKVVSMDRSHVISVTGADFHF